MAGRPTTTSRVLLAVERDQRESIDAKAPRPIDCAYGAKAATRSTNQSGGAVDSSVSCGAGSIPLQGISQSSLQARGARVRRGGGGLSAPAQPACREKDHGSLPGIRFAVVVGPSLFHTPHMETQKMNGRSLSVTAAVLLALAALGGCNREEDRVTTTPETTAPPAPAPAPGADAPPFAPPVGSSSTTPSAGDTTERTAGQTVDDAGITAKVKAALLSESGVDGLKINVDTFNGRVTLKGEVPNQGQVDKAGQVARGIEGVKDVDNRLTVSAG